MTPARITSIHITTTPPRRKPRAGDRRVTKAHGLQIRVMVRDVTGCFVVSNGRQLYEWRKPEHLATFDHCHLTIEEREHYFPPKYKLGYMQMRGAA